jgi:hypothetical protein
MFQFKIIPTDTITLTLSAGLVASWSYWSEGPIVPCEASSD